MVCSLFRRCLLYLRLVGEINKSDIDLLEKAQRLSGMGQSASFPTLHTSLMPHSSASSSDLLEAS